jgi:hypothetical protein
VTCLVLVPTHGSRVLIIVWWIVFGLIEIEWRGVSTRLNSELDRVVCHLCNVLTALFVMQEQC